MKEFIEIIEEFGGVYNTKELKCDLSNAIVLNVENEEYAPKFQFTEKSGEIVMNPLFENIIITLRCKSKISNVRLVSFFIIPRNIMLLGDNSKVNVIDLLNQKTSYVIESYIKNLIDNHNTNNLL